MKKMLMAAAAAVFAVAGSASAAITNIEFVQVPITHAPTADGHIANDLRVTATSDWTLAELITNLTSGAIFQDATFGSNTPPNAAFFPIVPQLEFDTYVKGPGAGESPSFAGGAVDIGGAPGVTFTTQKIDAAWFNTNTSDLGTFTLGRFTMTKGANGTGRLYVASADSAPVIVDFFVTNGVVAIPEPASLGLLGLGGLALAARRRQA